MEPSIPQNTRKHKFRAFWTWSATGLLLAVFILQVAFILKEGSQRRDIFVTETFVPEPIVIGSKSSKKYYFPWCYGARRLKEEQKQVFKDKKEAREEGFAPGKACKGND